MEKLCECGCGEKTSLVVRDIPKEGVKKGDYRRFKKCHHNKVMRQGYKNGQFTHKGYVYIFQPDHPHPTQGKYVKRSRLVMEQIIGRYLTSKEHVHHINEIRDDDRPENLEVTTLAEHNKQHEKTKKMLAKWTGSKHKEQTKMILSKQKIDKKLSKEHREKISKGLRRFYAG